MSVMILDYVTLHSEGWFLPVIGVAAFVDSFNPCAFSILFLTITFLFSLGKNRRFILVAGSAYIFGIALIYTLIGVGILQTLSIFNVPNVMAKLGAGILILYGVIELINDFVPNFPIKLKIPNSTHSIIAKVIHKASVPASFGLGILVGIFEFPCTGGPYLFVMSLLHDQGKFWTGFGYLLIYNFIFVLPLIVMLGLSANQKVLEKLDRLRKLETKKARVMFSAVLIFIGVLILFA